MFNLDKTSGFLKNFLQLIGIRGVALFLSFGLAIFMARVFGPEMYGVYSFALAVFTIIQPLAGGGVSTLAIRDIASISPSNPEKSNKILEFVYVTTLWSLSFCGILAFFVLATGLFQGTLLYLVFIAVPSAVLLETCRGVLAGQDQIKLGQFATELVRPTLFATFAVLLWVLPNILFNATNALIATSLSSCLIALGALHLSKTKLAYLSFRPPSLKASLSLLKLSLPFAAITALQYIHTRVDILSIGHLMTAADVGYYQVATRLAQLTAMPASLVAIMIAPKVSRYYAGDNFKKMHDLFWKSQLPAVGFSIPILFFFILLGDMFVTIMFGQNYAPAHTPLKILACAQALFSCISVITIFLTMTQREHIVLWVVVVSSLTNWGLNVALISMFGLNGAAIATSIVGILTLMALSIALYKTALLRKPPVHEINK